jgi:tetratricopeptide (TPR) repeat protein
MAKLVIFRGDAQLTARELTEQTVRIGRGAQNDIVLEDPGKGVSRNHAELRFEDGRYTLVDLQSQNGIWVSGERVPSVVLEPGVSAALGPFRLMVEAPVVGPVAAVSPVAAVDPATEMTQLSSRTAAPLELDSLVPPPEKPSPVAPPAAKPTSGPPPAKAPAAKPAAAKAAPPPARKTPAQQPASSTSARTIGIVAATVVLIALSAFIGYRLMNDGRPKTMWDAALAQQMVSSGRCQEALEKLINPALQADPNNQQALALKNGCTSAPPPAPSIVTSSIPAGPTADERLNQVEPLVTANVAADCQRALETINAVLGEDPNNERAKGLQAKATACANPAPARGGPPATASLDKPAVAVPPAQGGLDVIQGETEKAYRSRMTAMRKKYDDAVAILTSQDYVQAMKALDEIVPEVPSGYLDLAARRDEARSGIRAEAKSTYGRAQAAEGRGDFDGAVGLYRRAHQLDLSIPVEEHIQRIINIVRKKCEEARLDLAFDSRNQTAISALQEAVKVLPATDGCAVSAKERLQQLKK